jgi:glycosyltransferase involved in cell wall biosynthesis
MPKRICIYPRVTSVGGVGSFQLKFSAGLERRGIQVTQDLDGDFDALLLLAGTRDLPGLRRVKKRGIPIIQRLDGINWVQRRRRTSLRYFLRAEYGNLSLSFARRYIADRVVYQSEFIRTWWESWYGPTRVPHQVIYNGVDLEQFSPQGKHERPAERVRLLVVEGSLAGGLDFGLFLAADLAEALARTRPVELAVVGRVTPLAEERLGRSYTVPIQLLGVLPRERIPEIDRSAHLFYSAEVQPPCPNAVIEALACGLPVVGFATGSLPEIVTGDAGRLVPYGGDAWRFERPDIASLTEAALEVLKEPERFHKAARARAESAFGLEAMVERYLEILYA